MEVVEVAREIACYKEAVLHLSADLSQKNREAIAKIIISNGWGKYLIDNALVATQALDLLSIRYNISDLKSLKLFGRYQQIAPNIHIDVGHNPLAAEVIVNSIDDRVTLIYNSLDDKDYKLVLEILKPKLESVEILTISNQRAITLINIEKALNDLGLKYSIFNGTIDKDKEYLVFGSFYVVEKFLSFLPNI